MSIQIDKTNLYEQGIQTRIDIRLQQNDAKVVAAERNKQWPIKMWLSIALFLLLMIYVYTLALSSAVYASPSSSDTYQLAELFELGDTVWFDANGNAQFDPGEEGIAGVQLTLLDDFGNPYDIDPTLAGVQGYSTTTGSSGDYLFTLLITDTYRVGIDAINFQPGGALEGYSAIPPASTMPNDNVDGDSNGIAIGPLATNGLFSGSIDLNVANHPTFINRTIDFGFYKLTVGNRVWEDIDNNGLYDASREAGLPNITVNLLDSNLDTIATTTTDSNGIYTFTNLISGTYTIEIVPLSGYASSWGGGEESSPVNNGDGNDNGLNQFIGGAIQSAPIALTPGDIGAAANNQIINETGNTVNPTVDFGIWKFENLGHLVWQDANNNGAIDANEPGIDGVTVELFRDDGDGLFDAMLDVLVGTKVTTDGGRYAFDQLTQGDYFLHIPAPPSAYPTSSTAIGTDDVGVQNGSGNATTSGLIVLGSEPNSGIVDGTNGTESRLDINFGFFAPIVIGDMVWYDYEQDGLQIARDDGVPSVDVILYNTNDTVAAAITTDSDGRYEFENMAPGDYYIVFIPPSGYELSPIDVGENDAIDSDADPVTGRTAVFSATTSTVNDRWDAGVYIPTRIGNYVWFDADGDGIQGTDPAETPIADVLVEVLNAAGTIITQTTTSSAGEYEFNGLTPGDYVIRFTPPAGLAAVLPNQGDSQTLDSDISLTDFTVETTLTSGESELDIDAGFSNASSIGGFAWLDTDGDSIRGTDPTETPAPNLQVLLFNINNVLVGQTTTDASGAYSFANVPSGQYFIEFAAVPGFVFVPANGGGDDTIDSDVGSNGTTAIITLQPGDNLQNVSAGLFETAAIGNYVWRDADSDGTQGQISDEPPLANVDILIYDGNGILIAQTETDQDGRYEFTGLTPGEYFLEVLPPQGFVITTPDQVDDDQDSDADRTTGQTPITILQPGENDTSWDFGLLTPAEFRGGDSNTPNAISLSTFTVQEGPAGSKTIVVRWETSAEIDTLGFYILRSREDGFRSARTLSPYMVESLGAEGGSYEVSYPYNPILDPPLDTFNFWLVELEVSGRSSHYPAITLEGQAEGLGYQVYLPTLNK